MNTKGNIAQLLDELRGACRLPLFNGIGDVGTNGRNLQRLRPVGVRDTTPAPKTPPTWSSDVAAGETETLSVTSSSQRNDNTAKRQRVHNHGGDESDNRVNESGRSQPRTWVAIVADASDLVPLMTEKEHGQVSRLVAILFLGFLLPQSTGNDFFSLRNLSTARNTGTAQKQQKQRQQQPSGAKTFEKKSDMGEYVLTMSLEERLECSSHRYNADGFGELDGTIMFEPVEAAFQVFLRNGLQPFLRARPAHTQQVDLLHILAMAIHPQPSEQSIRDTAVKLGENKSEAWESTKRLMQSLVPHSFHVNYRHRRQLTHLVAEHLVLPRFRQSSAQSSAPLFEGALPHLRISLYAFGMAALSPYDGHVAQRGLFALATQSGMDHVVKEEWGRLLHRLVDDQTIYEDEKVDEQTINLHWARGQLLNQCLLRICESRYFANDQFLQYAMGSLTDAIEMQVDCWTVEQTDDCKSGEEEDDAAMKDPEKEEATTTQPPDILVSLLSVAKNLFYFLLPLPDSNSDDDEEKESDDSHRRDMLISCGIQLIHHWHRGVVKEACTMLILAFSYSEELWDDYVGAVFASSSMAITLAVNGGRTLDAVEGLVAAFSQRSPTFAGDVLQLLLEKATPPDRSKAPFFRLVSAIATACPDAAVSKREVLLKNINSLSKSSDYEAKKHLLASILALRKASFFENEKTLCKEMIELIQGCMLDGWSTYRLAQHSLQTGNPGVAKNLFGGMVHSASSQSSFLWFSAMEQIAAGESTLMAHGTMSLTDSAASMKKASSLIQFLSGLKETLAFAGSNSFSLSFQIHWLELRVCHLDLLRILRQLTQEMRLTGMGPKKNTRPHLHLSNAIKFLDTLSVKYRRFDTQYGLFICQQSRSALRTLQGHCSFLAAAARKVFCDSLSFTDQVSIGDKATAGDSSQPLLSLAKRFQQLVFKEMESSVDGRIRATVMLQVLDGTVKVPFPIPRALTVAKFIPEANFRVIWDPSEHKGFGENGTVDVLIATHLKFLVSGSIPAALVLASKIPFNAVLVWITITPLGTKGSSTTGENSRQTTKSLGHASKKTSISPGGCFFTPIDSHMLLQEGRQSVTFQLGCRDIRGGEWELPTQKRTFSVNVVIPS